MTVALPTPMEEVAQSLTKDVKFLSEYLVSTGHPVPSFDRHTPTVVLPDDASRDAHVARERILDNALKLLQLATGPSEYLATLQTGYHYLSCLRWLCHFRVFHLVPLQGSVSYVDLAVLANVPEDSLKAIARMAITSGLFVENPPQHLAHSATSALLCTNENFHDWAVFMSDISAPTAAAMVDAHEKWPNSHLPTQTAYNLAFHTDLPFFKHLGQHPERHRQFAGYMRSVTTSQGTGLNHLVVGWDWAALGRARVVDVGGSTGHASISLAREFPELSFVVEDLPEVVAGGPEYLASLPDADDLECRIEYRAHSFFDPQPVTDGDVYLLRMILHDWPAEDSVRILSRLVQALKPGARIIVMDTVLPSPGAIPASKERLLRVRDLTMMQVFNSRERHMEDWIDIFRKVDGRLTMKKVEQPFGSVMSLIELHLDE
ncbi:hypothetical protein EYZ11_003576 [Aspergillus tanneri]|uniref:O-methyltransferase C-terminal domain-containing protein n=1 Tax=Aspergillus tanneri TaxID=1220188 RepID=A0A4S3JQ62_9EURO|nr:uncharacterized protein ATNIH1004_008651 [Aspergillus tanneri]KAA8644447.1 hypothetical protein ATNIH1004_008651 [Aspergillus tanneri]THC96968.1 hypothetical protein EYZ11_003576 [Aspergillus tanneri]